MQFTFLEVYGGLQCKNQSKNKKNAAAADDDDDDYDDAIFSNSSNYLQDFDQSKLFTMIIVIQRESQNFRNRLAPVGPELK